MTTLEETRLLEIGKDAFAAILAAEPGLVEALGESLRARLAERREAIADSGRPDAEPQDLFRSIRGFLGL